MHCQSCGAETNRELNYCSRCGASTAPETTLVPINLTKPALAIGMTVALITLGGFGLLISGAVKLAEVFKVPDPIMAILVLGIFTIVFCDIMLLRMLSRIVNASLQAGKEKAVLPKQVTRDRDTSRQLNSPQFEPVPSVTEHTTRTFTPVYRETPERGTK
ncbi:MAG TPA: hypothetical protein VGN86_02545 [Pyrinomonadaceae bacterium]|jgi:hypothetical protein|nr:hypothetical protein [Pyrinomonadaceae bacterium]